MLKRRSKEMPLNGASARELPCPDDFKECPNLWEFLTVQWWAEERKVRQTGTLLVFVEGGDRKIMLNDRDAGLMAFVTVLGDQGVLEAAEAALDSPKTDWRAPRQPGAGGPRR
jgi:hypothetical protein